MHVGPPSPALPSPVSRTLSYTQTLAIRNQSSALGHWSQRDTFIGADDWHARRDNLREHFAALPPLACRQVIERDLNNFFCVLRAREMATIRPAITMWLNDAALLVTLRNMQAEELHGRSQPVFFYTNDHVQLDGLLIRPQGPVHGTVVCTLGNSMVYEAFHNKALSLCDARSVQVLLYNDRGTGRSLGRQCTVQQAVLDCRAALQYARTLSGGAPIGVFGFSFGGAVTAEALRQEQEAGTMTAADVSHYVICNTFSLMSRFFAQGATEAKVIRRFERRGIDNLDTEQTLHTPRAVRTTVLTATNDMAICESARLSTALRASPNRSIEFIDEPWEHERIELYFSAGYEHLDDLWPGVAQPSPL